jgi:hypothetical protein
MPGGIGFVTTSGMAREKQKFAGLFRDIKFTTIRDVLAI